MTTAADLISFLSKMPPQTIILSNRNELDMLKYQPIDLTRTWVSKGYLMKNGEIIDLECFDEWKEDDEKNLTKLKSFSTVTAVTLVSDSLDDPVFTFTSEAAKEDYLHKIVQQTKQ